MCIYPTIIKNRKYMPNKKNKGIIPEIIDDRMLYVPIGCGKCFECMKQKKRNWQIRITEEIKINTNGKFVCLTFSNENINEICDTLVNKGIKRSDIEDNQIATWAVRHFLERWRKEFKKSIKHWFVTELGHQGTERIHIHGIIWTDDVQSIVRKWEYGNVCIGKTFFKPNDWQKANAETSYVNNRSVNYIVKYVNKIDKMHKAYMPVVLTSPGIGKNYLNREDSKRNSFDGTTTKEYYEFKDGTKVNLPIYYRNAIYTEEERAELWLNKLSENIRYIDGVKIDINKPDGEKRYFNVLESARRKNTILEYGNNEKEWSKRNYINQMHKLKFEKKFKRKYKTE